MITECQCASGGDADKNHDVEPKIPLCPTDSNTNFQASVREDFLVCLCYSGFY